MLWLILIFRKHSKRKSQSNRKTESSEEEDYSKNENEVSFKEFDSEIIDCVMEEVKVRPNKKKMPVFKVTRPYLNLLVKPRFFFRFAGKKKFYAF